LFFSLGYVRARDPLIAPRTTTEPQPIAESSKHRGRIDGFAYHRLVLPASNGCLHSTGQLVYHPVKPPPNGDNKGETS
jgi:hypothetical protein